MSISVDQYSGLQGNKLVVYTLENMNRLSVELSNYGASVLRITTPDKENRFENIVIRLKEPTDYLKTRSYLGATIGRVAGRISQGSAPLTEVPATEGSKKKTTSRLVQLSKNESPHHLHGGFVGLDNQYWTSCSYETAGEATVVFSLFSPDKMEGYPGNMMIQTHYTLTNDNRLIIKYRAYSDQDTLFNPTNHLYFNLSGGWNRVLMHELCVPSEYYCPITNESIPVGILKQVKGTIFDLNQPKPIQALIKSGEESIVQQHGLNHPWLLKKGESSIILREPTSGRCVKIQTDRPAVVVYTGNYLEENTLLKKQGIVKHAGIALECQELPDAGKYPDFGSTVLKANTFFESKTIYTFDVYKIRKEEKK